MVCKNSSCPYITSLVPSGVFKPSWQTGLPSRRPRILFCLTHPQHNWQLSSNCRIFITRDDWNYKKNPAEFFTSCWVSTRTSSPVPAPLPPPSNYPRDMCGPASAGSSERLIDVTSLFLWTSLHGRGSDGHDRYVWPSFMPAETSASLLYLPKCLAWSHPEVHDQKEIAGISLGLLGPHDNILVTLSANEPFSVISFLSLVHQQAFIKHLLSAQYWVNCSEGRHREARGYQGI